MRTSAKILGSVIAALTLVTGLLWFAAFGPDHSGALTVSFLNVGQGDAVFVRTPSGRQLLIDGGPDDSVLRKLGDVMPFYDRSIDIVIATAPTSAKVGGLTSVLSRYNVSTIIRSAAISNAPQVQSFTGAIANAEQNGTRLLTVQRGQVIDLGDNTFIELFFPDRDASLMSASDGCLIMKLVFGNTSFFFACGSAAIENYVATLDGTKLKSDVLAATGNDPELFVGFVSPQYAIVPCDSSANPSAFTKLEVQTIDTCDGTITFVSDGQTIAHQ
jgi:competence protein ComEC